MKLSQLLSKEYLVSVLREKDDLMRFEYCGRQKQVFRLMTVVPISWDKKGMLEKVMCISQDIGEKHELEILANTDGLTGLFNERYFTMMLESKEKKKLPFVLVYLDLDQFKPINDTYGHTMGDKLLQETAKRLLLCIRKNDYVFRIGGDEFACLVPCSDETMSRDLYRTLHSAFDIFNRTSEKAYNITVFTGFYLLPKDMDSTLPEMLAHADAMLYEEKQKRDKNVAKILPK